MTLLDILFNIELATGFAILVTLVFILDLFIPDPLPFIDEILLGIASIAAWTWVFILRVGIALSTVGEILTSPLIVAFLVGILFFFVLSRFRPKKTKKGKAKKKRKKK